MISTPLNILNRMRQQDHGAAVAMPDVRGGKRARQRSNPTEPPKVFYLIGEPGYPNYGDELIAGEWLKYLVSRYPDIPVVLDCARPGSAAIILREKHPHVTFTDTLFRLATDNPFPHDGPINDIAGFVAEALRNDGFSPNYASGVRLLQNDVRSIHVIGGGYMRGDWTANLSRLSIGPWAREREIPAVGTGIGLMPISGDSLEYAQRCVAAFKSFTVRDAATYDVLQQNAEAAAVTMLAPDDCFVNGLEGLYMSPEGLPDTMLCIQSEFITDEKALFALVERTLEHWGVSKDSSIGIVECNPRIDARIVPYLHDHGYTILRFFPTVELLEHGFPARQGQRWISTRYHPHILAAAAGCSGSYISVSANYYDVKHEAVKRMGSHWTQIVSPDEIPMPGAGFTDSSAIKQYEKSIRKSVAAIYP